tara:strand:+ start:192 stop:431 length:240 start_codon:yes stop_codon:yes gene_type:complete
MKVEIYSLPNCPACKKALHLATNHQAVHEAVYNMMGKEFDASDVKVLFPMARTFPQIVVDGEHIGGYIELDKLLAGIPT